MEDHILRPKAAVARNHNETPEEGALRRIEEAEQTGATELSLFGLGLTSLPEAIGRLTDLTALHLGGNQLTSLPEAIGRLTNLTTLDVTGNRLTALPEAISQLTKLKDLRLHGNAALNLPPEILGPDQSKVYEKYQPANPQVILRYYFRQRTTPLRPLAEAKVLVVGQGAVGKTSLIKYWLRGATYDGLEEKTTSIEISRSTISTVPYPDGRRTLDVTLNVWDFGGQEIYHATHQFFLSKRSVYLLVLDARQTEDQNNVHYWFQMARCYGGDSPVLVVINKSEQHHLELNETRLRKEYGDQFAGVVRVSCRQPFGRDELTAAVRAQLAKLTDVFNGVPESYFEVKAELERKAKRENFLPYEAYEKLCRRKKVTEAADQTTLLRFLHDLGVVLNFDDEGNPYRLRDTTILNPEWVTRGVYAILNDHRLHQSRGVLTRKDLDRVLAAAGDYPPDRQGVIVGMMALFELCFEFPDRRGERWLVPELLYEGEPDLDWREMESLNFQYTYEVLPRSIITRLIVRMNSFISMGTYWRYGAVFDIEGHRTLVRADLNLKKLFITVQGALEGRRSALAIVRTHLDRIHETFPGLRVQALVPIPGEPSLSISLDHLLAHELLGMAHVIPEGASRVYSVECLLSNVRTSRDVGLIRTVEAQQNSLRDLTGE